LGGCWLESADEAVEVGAGELPLERGGDLLVAAAKLEQGALKGVIGLGLDPVRVSKQLEHTNAGFTASTYAHEFERARHADDLRKQIGGGFGRLLDVNEMSASARSEPQPEPAKVAEISQIHG
jgi:hypothetical protein